MAIALWALVFMAAHAQPLENPNILVEDDDVQVTERDMLAAIGALPEEHRQMVRRGGQPMHQLLDSIFMRRVMALRALQGMHPKPTEEQVAEATESLEDPELVQSYAMQLRERKLAQELLREVDENADREAARSLARERFIANRSDFMRPEEVRVRHILIREEDRAPGEARELAEELLGQLQENASRFEALAQEYSEDPGSSESGGDLGRFPRGRMIPAFEEAAFSMQEGEISGIVETQFGFHILRLEERWPERQPEFEDVEEELVEQVLDQQRRGRRQEYLDEIRERPESTVHWDRVEEFEQRLRSGYYDE